MKIGTEAMEVDDLLVGEGAKYLMAHRFIAERRSGPDYASASLLEFVIRQAANGWDIGDDLPGDYIASLDLLRYNKTLVPKRRRRDYATALHRLEAICVPWLGLR